MAKLAQTPTWSRDKYGAGTIEQQKSVAREAISSGLVAMIGWTVENFSGVTLSIVCAQGSHMEHLI